MHTSSIIICAQFASCLSKKSSSFKQLLQSITNHFPLPCV